MSHLDQTGQAMLARLVERHEPGVFADVPEASATDAHGALTVTVDAARRLVGARVLDSGQLRRAEAFVGAVRIAFAVADGERALASLELSGMQEQFLARAEASLAGQSPVISPEPPDVSHEASLARQDVADAGGDRAPSSPTPSTSSNGYLTLHRAPDGYLVRIDVDPEWLSGARPEYVERALVEAGTYEMEM